MKFDVIITAGASSRIKYAEVLTQHFTHLNPAVIVYRYQENILIGSANDVYEQIHTIFDAERKARERKVGISPTPKGIGAKVKQVARKYGMSETLDIKHGVPIHDIEDIKDLPIGISITLVKISEIGAIRWVRTEVLDKYMANYCIDYSDNTVIALDYAELKLDKPLRYLVYIKESIDPMIIRAYFKDDLIKYLILHNMAVPVPSKDAGLFLDEIWKSLTNDQLYCIYSGAVNLEYYREKRIHENNIAFDKKHM